MADKKPEETPASVDAALETKVADVTNSETPPDVIAGDGDKIEEEAPIGKTAEEIEAEKLAIAAIKNGTNVADLGSRATGLNADLGDQLIQVVFIRNMPPYFEGHKAGFPLAEVLRLEKLNAAERTGEVHDASGARPAGPQDPLTTQQALKPGFVQTDPQLPKGAVGVSMNSLGEQTLLVADPQATALEAAGKPRIEAETRAEEGVPVVPEKPITGPQTLDQVIADLEKSAKKDK